MQKLPITIQLTESTYSDLSDIAKAHHTTVAEIVRQRLETCSDEHVDTLALLSSEINAYRSQISEQQAALAEQQAALADILAALSRNAVPPPADNA